jgi:uncharacterized protein (DUF433 family)
MAMNFREHFERDPNICAGQIVFRGTRVILRTILASIADGDTDDEILNDFPALTADDLRAAIAFAAASAVEGMPLPPLPAWAEAASEVEPSAPVSRK